MRVLLFLLLLAGAGWAQAPPSPVQVLFEVSGLVRKHFFDPKLHGLDWDRLVDAAEAPAKNCRTWDQLGEVVNGLLAHLETSHTHYYPPNSRGYHDLNGVFASVSHNPRYLAASKYDTIGIDVQNGYIAAILDGATAAGSGLLVGDKVLSVDGRPYHEIDSFAGRKRVRVKVQRTAAPDSLHEVVVPVEAIVSDQFYLRALKSSCKTVEQNGVKVAYVHVWSYAGDQYQDALVDALSAAPLKDCAALVLDVRDGWGGAQPRYLNLFNKDVPECSMIDRDGHAFPIDQQWRKPVVFLVNAGSRSGKELLAYGFKRFHLGPVVGERTAGFVVGGRLYPLQAGGGLYLAVADVTVEGKRLEGVGVEPDTVVERPIPFCQGDDPQLREALRQAAALASPSN